MNHSYKAVITVISDEGISPSLSQADIDGKPLIQCVYESAKSAGAEEVVIATDSPRVGMTAEDFGATVCMLVDGENYGLDRLADIAEKMSWTDQDVIIDIPADAPRIPPELIGQIASNLSSSDGADGAVLYSLTDAGQASQERSINMVVDNANFVMYMSHHAIPHCDNQTNSEIQYKNYLGISAYSVGVLRTAREMTAGGADVTEGIEVLKLLYNGKKVHAAEAVRDIGQRILSQDDVDTLTQAV